MEITEVKEFVKKYPAAVSHLNNFHFPLPEADHAFHL